MVYCEASVHTFRHRIESWSHCLHICANIFIALSQIKRGNKFNARTHFKLFLISFLVRRRRKSCAAFLFTLFSKFCYKLSTYFPSQHTIHRIYHTSGWDGVALREQSFPPFLDGRAWVGWGSSANSHWLPLAHWFGWGGTEGATFVDAGWWTREGSIGGQGCGLIFERLILDIIPAKEKLVGVTRTNDFTSAYYLQ